MSRIETALHNATTAYSDAKNGLSAGTKRGSTILGRFEVIKNLQNKSTKEIPDKFLKEIDILPDDEDQIQITHIVDDVEIEDPE
jgi:DNA recombination protein RmuC